MMIKKRFFAGSVQVQRSKISPQSGRCRRGKSKRDSEQEDPEEEREDEEDDDLEDPEEEEREDEDLDDIDPEEEPSDDDLDGLDDPDDEERADEEEDPEEDDEEEREDEDPDDEERDDDDPEEEDPEDETRVDPSSGSGERRVISGYAIRFNESSVQMSGWENDFVEVIAPEAITEEFLRSCDIKMTLFHNREKLLARWNKGEGSLRLSVDEKGVRFEFEVPDSSFGQFAVDAVERGDIAGCSFTFSPGDYDVEDQGDGLVKITHRKLTGLYEMTLETDPAYPTTEVSARNRQGGAPEGRRDDGRARRERAYRKALLRLSR